MGQNVVYNTTHPTTSSLTHFLTQQHTTLQSITQHSIITHLSLDHTSHSNSPSIIPHTTHYSLTCLRHGTTHHSLTHSLSLTLTHSGFPRAPSQSPPLSAPRMLQAKQRSRSRLCRRRSCGLTYFCATEGGRHSTRTRTRGPIVNLLCY